MKKIKIVFGDQSYVLASDELLSINDKYVVVHGVFDRDGTRIMLPFEFLSDVVIFEDWEEK